MDEGEHRHGRLVPLALMVCVGAVLAVGVFGRHMGVDEGIWNHMGRMWVHGSPVYRDTVDNKPPGIFMVFAMSYWIGGPGYLLPRMLGVLFLTATTGVVYLLGRDLHSRRAGLLAAAMFGLSMGWFVTDGAYLAQTESFMLLPAMLAFWMLLRPGNAVSSSAVRRSFQNRLAATLQTLLAGLLMGAALSFKQTVLFTALSWGVVYLFLARRDGLSLRRVAAGSFTFIVGVAWGMAVFVLPVLASGVEFRDYWFGTWQLPLLPGTGNPSLADRAVKTLTTWGLTPLVLFYLPMVLFFVRAKSFRVARRGGCATGILPVSACDAPVRAACGEDVPSSLLDGGEANEQRRHDKAADKMSARHEGKMPSSPPDRGGTPLAHMGKMPMPRLPAMALTIWLALEFIGAASSGFWYGHQIRQVLPVLAIMGGIGLAAALERAAESRRPRAFVAAFVVLAVTFMPYEMPYAAIFERGPDLSREIGLAVRDRCGPGDYVLNLDQGRGFQVLAWSDRPSPTRWFNGLLVHLPQAQAELQRDLGLRRPRIIVVPTWWYFDREPYPGPKPFPWPPCMTRYRDRCRWLATLPAEGDSYDIFECH